MTVQEVIDQLNKVEDKNQPCYVNIVGPIGRDATSPDTRRVISDVVELDDHGAGICTDIAYGLPNPLKREYWYGLFKRYKIFDKFTQDIILAAALNDDLVSVVQGGFVFFKKSGRGNRKLRPLSHWVEEKIKLHIKEKENHE